MFDYQQIILVESQEDQAKRPNLYWQWFVGNRKGTLSQPSQTAMMFPKTPNWALYQDTFVSVYSVTEAFVSGGATTGQPYQLFQFKSFRGLEIEDEYKRADHGLLHQYRWKAIGTLLPFTVEVPDFNDNPWLEWVHPGIDHASVFQPFRIPATPAAKYQPALQFWKPKFWDVAAEDDTLRLFPHSLMLSMFGHVTPIVVSLPTFVMDSMWRADQNGPAVGQGNVGITADTINYAADGSDLINGGAVGNQSGLIPPPALPAENPQPTISVVIRY